MLRDHVEQYYYDQNQNCAEALLHAANDYYGLGLDENSMRLVAGFGGGMQTGNICGAVLSAISILSMKYVEAKAHDSKDIKPVTERFLDQFQKALNASLLCRDLKAEYFSPEKRCIRTVLASCDVLEKVIEDYNN